MPKKDRYACFQWIRDVRARMDRDMEGMTPEQCSDYVNQWYERHRDLLPRYTLAESAERLAMYLAEPGPEPAPSAKKTRPARPARKAAGRKPAKARARA